MSNKLKIFNAIEQNLQATASLLQNEESMRRKPQLCWKCQKDKPLAGGSLKFFGGGVRRFICKQCVATRKEAA